MEARGDALLELAVARTLENRRVFLENEGIEVYGFKGGIRVSGGIGLEEERDCGLSINDIRSAVVSSVTDTSFINPPCVINST